MLLRAMVFHIMTFFQSISINSSWKWEENVMISIHLHDISVRISIHPMIEHSMCSSLVNPYQSMEWAYISVNAFAAKKSGTIGTTDILYVYTYTHTHIHTYTHTHIHTHTHSYGLFKVGACTGSFWCSMIYTHKWFYEHDIYIYLFSFNHCEQYYPMRWKSTHRICKETTRVW